MTHVATARFTVRNIGSLITDCDRLSENMKLAVFDSTGRLRIPMAQALHFIEEEESL